MKVSDIAYKPPEYIREAILRGDLWTKNLRLDDDVPVNAEGKDDKGEHKHGEPPSEASEPQPPENKIP